MRLKILLSFPVFFCMAITSHAQIDKGRYLLGGSLSYYGAKNVQPNNYYNYNYVSLYTNIQFGKVVKNNTVVGLIISYGNSDSHPANFPDSNYNKSTQYNAGVFYRKYKRLFNTFYIFGEVDAAYVHTDNTQGYFQNQSDRLKNISNGGSVSFVPGISYALFRRMQVELSMPNILSFSYSHFKTENGNTTLPSNASSQGNSFSLNASLNSSLLNNFGIGFKFLLGK